MFREIRIQTSDELSLYAWIAPAPGEPRGIIAHVHGMGEHSRRYDHLADCWLEHGYSAGGFDLRGHGRSEGKRGHTASYELLMDDIGKFLDRVRESQPSLPVTLYGHSTGGNLVLNYVIRRQPALWRVVASAPYLRLAFEPPAWKVALARRLHGIFPAFSQGTGLEVQALSRDPGVVARYRADPLVHDRISMAFFHAVHSAGEDAIRKAGALTIPTLVMHGSADRITSIGGSEAFVAASPMATLKVWDGYFHEIHNEPGWPGVAAYVLEWIEQS